MQFGQSAMMVASWGGHLGIVEALMRAEADPNLQDGVIFFLFLINLCEAILTNSKALIFDDSGLV